MSKPTKPQVEAALGLAESMDLSDGAHWMAAHELLGLEYGDLFPLMRRYGLLDEAAPTRPAETADRKPGMNAK